MRVVPQARVWHRFRTRPPYPVAFADVLHNRLRLALVHFNAPRLARVIESAGAEALLAAIAGGAAERRAQLFAVRKRDDDWFFDRFGIRW